MDIHRLGTNREDKGPWEEWRVESKFEVSLGLLSVVKIEIWCPLQDGVAFQGHGDHSVIALKTVSLQGKSGMWTWLD